MIINDSPFNISRYTDAYGNLIIKKRTNKQFQIFGSKIETGEILVESNHVYIEGLYEIPIQNQITDTINFKVDYKDGVIYFHSSKEGQVVDVNFYAKARVDWKALNVVLRDEDNLYNETTAEGAFKEIATRVNNIVANVGNSNSEIVDLRVDADNIVHPTAKHRADSDYNKLNTKIGDFEENDIAEDSLAEAINNDRNTLDIFKTVFSDVEAKYGLGNVVFGEEYLAPYHNLIMTRDFTTRQLKVVASGDSTTQGVAVDSAHNLVTLLQTRSMVEFSNITHVNNGVSGATCQQWASTYVNNDISANPDLLILRWGINDPSVGRTKEQYETDLRSGLTAIRNSKPNLSIILMTPNSIYDNANNRNMAWVESIIPAIKKAARDFNCVFVNTYQIWQDSYSAFANNYMDTPYSDSRHIHPLNVFNEWIVSKLYDLIYPSDIRYRYGNFPLTNVSILDQQISIFYPPNVFSNGISMHRSGSDFPYGNGSQIYTFKGVDGVALQINTSTGTTSGEFQFRIGNGTLWSPLTRVGGTSTPTAPTYQGTFVANSLGYLAPRYYKDGSGIIHLSGMMKGNGNNVTAFTLPSGYKPAGMIRFAQRSGGSTGICDIDILADGQVRVMSGDASNWVTLDGISFLAEN